MAPKRAFPSANDGRAESPTRSGGSKRLCSGRHDQGCMLQEFMEKLNPSELQRVEYLCRKYGVNVPHLSSRTRMYRLQFRNKLPNIIFTDRKLKAENNMEVEIAIVDASNMAIISGPEAKAVIEIVVLRGDFLRDDNGECPEEEFNNHVEVAREKKPPLLVGNLVIKLCDGVGYITDAKFTDNSSWTKSKNFRLGARLYRGEGMAGKVQEGISNAFRVKDRHGEKYQKDRPPPMNADVCCLKGISKNGPYKKELAKYQINTVEDLLSYCRANPHVNVGTKIGMKEEAWKKTYGHAIESLSLINSPVSLHTSDQMIRMTERAREETYGHATESESLFDHIIRNIPDNLLALDQNSFEVAGSNSFQISNARVQLDGIMQLPSNVEYESDMFARAQSLPATKSGTEQLGIPPGVLMDGNGRRNEPNKFGHIWLKLFNVARFKVVVRLSREAKSVCHNAHDLSNNSCESWPQCKNFSPRLTPDEDIDDNQKDHIPAMDDDVCCLKGISKNGPFKKKLVECNINTVWEFLCYCKNHSPEKLRTMIGMTERAWEITYGHATESESWINDILLNSPVNLLPPDQMIGHATVFDSSWCDHWIPTSPDNLLAPDQNYFEVAGSNSSQIPNVSVQPDGTMQLPPNIECESDMFTIAQSLSATKTTFESLNSFEEIVITGGIGGMVSKGTKQLDISPEVQMEGNGGRYGPSKFGDIWLQLFYVARFKVGVRRFREARFKGAH